LRIWGWKKPETVKWGRGTWLLLGQLVYTEGLVENWEGSDETEVESVVCRKHR